MNEEYRKKCKNHIKGRFKKRFDMDISNKDIKTIIDMVKQKKGNFIRYAGEGCKIYGLTVKNNRVWIVYDHNIDYPKTVLPNKENK